MMTLLKNKVIALDLFDERSIHEVTDPDDPARRSLRAMESEARARSPG
jgi:hypothetical protein